MNIVDETCNQYESDDSPLNSNRDGYTTYEETNGPLLNGIRDYLIREAVPEGTPSWSAFEYAGPIEAAINKQPLLITVHECWSGYSEYTITNTWQEVSIKWGTIERHFEGMAQFFRAIADASVAGADDARSRY